MQNISVFTYLFVYCQVLFVCFLLYIFSATDYAFAQCTNIGFYLLQFFKFDIFK